MWRYLWLYKSYHVQICICHVSISPDLTDYEEGNDIARFRYFFGYITMCQHLTADDSSCTEQK